MSPTATARQTSRILALATIFLYAQPGHAHPVTAPTTDLRFEVILNHPQSHPGNPIPPGRLIVILGSAASVEPRLTIGHTGMNAAPLLGRDVPESLTGTRLTVDAHAAIFPIDRLDSLPAGTYNVQAILHTNPDLNHPNAPGDLYSQPKSVHLDPAQGGKVELELSRQIPPEELPPDTELVKHIKIRSTLLSGFHGRPIDLRAGVILPRDFSANPDRHYPLRVHIGGYGSRYKGVDRMMASGSAFRQNWLADNTPRMILLHLDGAGPLGDPYQVDSANHGPYGAAVTRELIPSIESQFRGIGRGNARVLDGASTGGWVALALQIFYPEFFNGAWAFCPDSVDFRAFQLVDVYEDNNAYINRHGFERPGAREISGDVRYTMRHECQLENVLGRENSWTLSGGQWGAWNATYGPRSPNGHPVPLWDPQKGAIDHHAADHWKTYDLRHRLEQDWANLAPKLDGKLHIWVGEADDYFLNNAVHHLSDFLTQARPPYRGSITFGPGKGHCWIGITEPRMISQMAARMPSAFPAEK